MNSSLAVRATWIPALVVVVSLIPVALTANPDQQSSAVASPPRVEAVGGRVIDSDGRPVTSATVAILDLRSFDMKTCPGGLGADGCFERLLAAGVVRARDRSDADGRFTVQVPGGLTNFDTVWAEGEDATGGPMRNSWPIVPNRRLPTSSLGDIRLNRGLNFVVMVQGDGQPIAGADVDFGNGNRMRTDRTGSATYRLQVSASGGSGQWHVAFTVRAAGFASDEWAGGVPVGTTTHVVNLVRESRLAGRIFDAGRRPVAQALVAAALVEGVPAVGIATSHSTAPDQTVGSARTDAAGAFSLPGLRSGERYRLTITGPDTSVGNGQRIVTAGSVPIDIVMAAAAPVTLAISGLPDDVLMRNTDLRPDTPGPGISLEFLDPSSGTWLTVLSPRHVRWLGTDGAELRFDQVPAGTIRIVTDADFKVATDVSEPLTLVAGSPTVVPLKVAANRELRLQVNDRSRRPVSGARVEVFSHTGRSSSYTNTGADGSVTFRVHPAHDVKVTVSRSGKLVATTTVRGGAQPPPIVVASP